VGRVWPRRGHRGRPLNKIVRRLVRTVVSLVVAALIAPVAAWIIIGGICAIPGVLDSNACGHNAYVWFAIVGPVSFIVAALLVYRLIRERKERPSANVQDV